MLCAFGGVASGIAGVNPDFAKHPTSSPANHNGGLLYFAESRDDSIRRRLGSIDSNLYPSGTELGCSVCGVPKGDGSVYVNWGSRTCSDKATLLYEGLIGGAGYSNSGGPSNLMCLHGQPQNPSAQTPGTGPDRSNVYGVEYQTEAGYQPPGGAGLSSADGDAACAVCHAELSQVYVQWGRAESCSNGHVTMYSGWMMGEYSGHTGRNEMICASALACTHMATFASMRACAVLDIAP